MLDTIHLTFIFWKLIFWSIYTQDTTPYLWYAHFKICRYVINQRLAVPKDVKTDRVTTDEQL